jgi:L-asparagine transporter-like permease
LDDEDAIIEREAGLSKGLTRAQITMIGLGGAIGAGLFMGSGIAIGYAGPAVAVSWLALLSLADFGFARRGVVPDRYAQAR